MYRSKNLSLSSINQNHIGVISSAHKISTNTTISRAIIGKFNIRCHKHLGQRVCRLAVFPSDVIGEHAHSQMEGRAYHEQDYRELL